jgi:hypothetical protein
MKYLAYGSNMLTERLKARVSSAANPTLFALHGYKLRFHKKSDDCSGKCSIVKTSSEEDVVHGVIFDVAKNQIDALDVAEGVGHGYRRDEMTLKLGDVLHKVFVYVAESDATDDALVPYRWYYDLVLAGAEQQNLPRDYIAGLKAIPFTEDPKSDRDTRLKALDALEKYADSKKKADSSQK